ncbi:MAG: glucose-6-phosphate isomerase [Bacteroidales bacterium]|jgi:glucose-6-phosphate isomerase
MRLDLSNAIQFCKIESFENKKKLAVDCLNKLINGNGKGSDFLGWIDLPINITNSIITDIVETAKTFKNLDAVVIIGIGGSYLGAKAVHEALKPHFDKPKPEIIFAGHNLSGNYHSELLKYLNNKHYGIIVISKSGTTTEPAIAFRLLYRDLKQKFDKETIKKRIVAITDAKKGALRKLADKEGFKTFVIDDNVGGRFSVLSPVGLLPIAIAGYDIKSLLHGAANMRNICINKNPENPAIQYAALRNVLYDEGKKMELLVNYNFKLNYFSEWWKQLYGESEGKEGKGIFPVSVSFSTDLHSLGQYIQQGERHLFETNILVNDDSDSPIIPQDEEDLDQLNYIAGKKMEYVNRTAAQATIMAHVAGNVPNIIIEIDKINEYNLGSLIYFFEIACGISGYLLDVNPFDQPGVEDYKQNMFKLLGKK